MVDKATLRDQLEETRTAFESLVKSLTDADWGRKSANKAWNVRQMMAHIAGTPGVSAGTINMIRKGKGFNPPSFLINPVNVLSTRWTARGATRDSVIETYNTGHAKLLAALESVQENEWTRSAKFLGKRETMESVFRGVIEHFKEHEADVKKGLDRA